MTEELDALRRSLDRERRARREAELLLEEKSRALYAANLELRRVNAGLTQDVLARTAEVTRVALRLATLIRHLPSAVLVEDEFRRIAVVNSSFCRLFGVDAPPEALIGVDCAAAARASAAFFVSPEAFTERVDRIFARREVVVGERLEMLDGRILERDYVPVREGHEELGNLWNYRDVTAAERARGQLEAAMDVAERANVGKAQFLGMLGHEMRTPLAATLGLLELAVEAEPEERVRLVNRARAAARSLLRLTEDVLDFARIEQGALRLVSAPFSPRAVVDELVGVMEQGARARGLVLRSEVAQSVPPSMQGDAQRLRQVLSNLAANAIKATARGSVTIVVDAAMDGEDRARLRISVRDTGPGIAPDDRDRIFEPFEQLDAGRRAGGVGLGLTICRELVSSMGGALRLESTLGEGSTFTVDLPLPIVRAKASTSSSTTLPRIKLLGLALVVDDDEDNRFVLARMLERIGMEVIGCADAEAALARIAAERFDVIVTDCAMPRIDGPELIRRVRARERERERPPIRIIAVTANALDALRDACFAAGADAWLTKPPDLRKLAEAVASPDIDGPAGTAPLQLAALGLGPAPLEPARVGPAGTDLESLDPEVVARLPRYLERRRADLDRARSALAEGDLSSLARLGHDLRGSGGAYGMPEISEIGTRLEDAARAGEADATRSVLDALERALRAR